MKKETKGQNNDEHLSHVGRKGGDGNVSLCLYLHLLSQKHSADMSVQIMHGQG